MNGSKILAVVIAAALMFSNIACACATPEPSTERTEHHHMATGHDAASQPACPHQDCEGCDELLDSCATPEYSLLTKDRDGRLSSALALDLDDAEPDLSFVDTGQHYWPPPGSSPAVQLSAAVHRQADTPIKRKDQLTQ